MDEHKYWLVWKYPKKHIIDFIAPFYTQQQALDSMYGWWQQNDYKPPYVRINKSFIEHKGSLLECLWIDYSSHHMFYEIWETPCDFIPYRIKTNKQSDGAETIQFADSICLRSLLKENMITVSNGVMRLNRDKDREWISEVNDMIEQRKQSAYNCLHAFISEGNQ